MNETILQLTEVSRTYGKRVKAVDALTLAVEQGEFFSLLGPSGCGKTTTLRLVAGLETPDAGEIAYQGVVVASRARRVFVPPEKRHMGMVFQSYAIWPHLTVFENVAYGLRVRGVGGDALHRRVTDVLALVGLGGYEPQFPSQLSGGEQQRVALARAIVIEPRVLLFDEPLSNLDAKLRVQMRLEIRGLQRRLGITTVYVTHDQEEAMAVSDRIVVMDRGSVVQQGSAEDLYYRPASRFVAGFIGRVNLVPGTVARAADGTVAVAALGTILPVTQELRAGDAVQLVLRPEAITIASDGDPGSVRAKVVSRTFLGEKVEYLFDCGGTILQSVRYDAGPRDVVPEGAEVSLHLLTEGLSVLPGSSA
jgi:iron(III) transport system ATP-binding protein